ncbi:hypothetical protein PoB_007461100 [Plakobranchus ocellatus]|uniref:Uncharacterized protein n=1 Tax=Plakobranchus ocellatus TaxID=259542 RepID=A0AAV4DW73_9GAST|nr:hypothetical protein PoB_007461100 [Plakobranchus ocellatus]
MRSPCFKPQKFSIKQTGGDFAVRSLTPALLHGILCIASPQQVDPKLSGLPQTTATAAGLEFATEGSLQISGWTR